MWALEYTFVKSSGGIGQLLHVCTSKVGASELHNKRLSDVLYICARPGHTSAYNVSGVLCVSHSPSVKAVGSAG